jgi:hypothetical protein
MSKQAGQEEQIPNPTQIQKFLKGVDYPVTKQDLLEMAQDEGADENVLNALQQIPDREYSSPVAVSKEVGKLS